MFAQNPGGPPPPTPPRESRLGGLPGRAGSAGGFTDAGNDVSDVQYVTVCDITTANWVERRVDQGHLNKKNKKNITKLKPQQGFQAEDRFSTKVSVLLLLFIKLYNGRIKLNFSEGTLGFPPKLDPVQRRSVWLSLSMRVCVCVCVCVCACVILCVQTMCVMCNLSHVHSLIKSWDFITSTTNTVPVCVCVSVSVCLMYFMCMCAYVCDLVCSTREGGWGLHSWWRHNRYGQIAAAIDHTLKLR